MAYQNFYATKTQTSIGASDTSFSVQTPPTALTGRLVLEPRNASQREIISYTGVSGTTLTGVTRGLYGTTAKAHNSGVLIEMNFLAEDYTDLVDAFNSFSSTNGGGWYNVPQLPSTITYNGNRSYDVVIPSTDLTSIFHPGTRARFTRNTASPTQCTSLNGTNQYYSKSSPAGMTFTDDFVVSAWVKLSSYPSATAAVVSRYNGTSGWNLFVDTTGQIIFQGHNAGAGNYSRVTSYQSLPLNRWVHITAQLDMSSFTATTTTSYIMVDGVDVPCSVARAGTNPTALVQAGDFQIGAYNGATGFFPGKIAQAAVFNAKVTQATIRGYISQGLAGNETSLISAYSFNNSITDLNTSNANNLTANGSAVATNADSPFGIQDNGTVSSTLNYGIVQKATFSTNTTLTVQVPEGNTLPTTGTVSALSYSNVKAPYGMPVERGKWILDCVVRSNLALGVGALNTNYDSNIRLNIPIGSWIPSLSLGYTYFASTTTGTGNPNEGAFFVANTASVTDTIPKLYMRGATSNSGATTGALVTGSRQDAITLSSATSYSIWYNEITYTGGAASAGIRGDVAISSLFAENAYL